MYIFHPVIFKASKATQPGRNGEIQLTDPIQKLVDWGLNVYAIILDKNYAHLDIVAPKGTGMLWTCLISTFAGEPANNECARNSGRERYKNYSLILPNGRISINLVGIHLKNLKRELLGSYFFNRRLFRVMYRPVAPSNAVIAAIVPNGYSGTTTGGVRGRQWKCHEHRSIWGHPVPLASTV